MKIRQVRSDEYDLLQAFLKTAFETARYAEGDEYTFAANLRFANGYIPELELVVEEEGAIVAHLMLTQVSITGTSGDHPVLLLAIVSVLLSRRREGIGKAIIEDAFQRARKMRRHGVVVVGDPGYYARFGFRPSTAFGILNANGFEEEVVMALELLPNGLAGAAGYLWLPS